MDISSSDRSQLSAYHGGSWLYRESSHRDEVANGTYWTPSGAPSEFAPLHGVLLYTPPSVPIHIAHPEQAQHLRAIDWETLRAEYKNLKSIFEQHDVRVHDLAADLFPESPPNLMFTRDLFFRTPWGAVLARMASPVRAGEEKWAQLALAQAGVPLLGMIAGTGLFEGADALWLDAHTVGIGIGNRTNSSGALQLQEILKPYGVSTLLLPLPKSAQHLLGVLQIVDTDTALVRTSILEDSAVEILRSRFANIIEVPEISEVTEKQGMNIVSLGPKKIIMAANCPALRELYLKNKMEVAAEVEISQYLNAAGGIACATGILSR